MLCTPIKSIQNEIVPYSSAATSFRHTYGNTALA